MLFQGMRAPRYGGGSSQHRYRDLQETAVYLHIKGSFNQAKCYYIEAHWAGSRGVKYNLLCPATFGTPYIMISQMSRQAA